MSKPWKERLRDEFRYIVVDALNQARCYGTLSECQDFVKTRPSYEHNRIYKEVIDE